MPSQGRNEKCACGSKKKFKACCLKKELEAELAKPVKKEPKEAVREARRAAADTPEQIGRRGENYYFGCNGSRQDAQAGVRLFRKAAEMGHARSQYNLGASLDKGTGCPQDEVEAMTWFHKAALQQYPGAQYMLGLMKYKEKFMTKTGEIRMCKHNLRSDQCVPCNDAVIAGMPEAIENFKLAAQQGHAGAKVMLSNLLGKQDTMEGRAAERSLAKYYKDRIRQDEGQDAMRDNLEKLKLSRCCASCGISAKDEGVKLSSCSGCALMWYCSDKCSKINWVRHKGECVQEQKRRAEERLARGERADLRMEMTEAERAQNLREIKRKKDAEAAAALAHVDEAATSKTRQIQAANTAEQIGRRGESFFFGCNDHPQDTNAGVRLFRRAAEMGHPRSQYNLGACYEKGDGDCEASDEEAQIWFAKAAKQNYPGAQYMMGLQLYKKEFLTKQGGILQCEHATKSFAQRKDQCPICNTRTLKGVNCRLAVKWFEKAAAQDHAGAKVMLANLQGKQDSMEGRAAERSLAKYYKERIKSHESQTEGEAPAAQGIQMKVNLEKLRLSRCCAKCNVSAAKEGVKLASCSGCALMHYCSTDCAKAHWKDHKAECKVEQQRRKDEKAEKKRIKEVETVAKDNGMFLFGAKG